MSVGGKLLAIFALLEGVLQSLPGGGIGLNRGKRCWMRHAR